MSLHRDFKGIWIPKEIWLSKDLTIMEKLFLVEIESLDNENGCFASNAHFAEMFEISKGRCTQIIKSLESKGYVKIQLIREQKVISKRLIRVVNKLNTLFNKLNTPIKNIKQGYLENDEGNNTLTNNTKGDIDTSAFEFLRINYPSRFEQQFQMRYSKSIIRKKDFIEHFDNTVQIEMESKNLKWTDKSLFPRLSNFANVWVSNQKKYDQDQNEEKPVYLRKVR